MTSSTNCVEHVTSAFDFTRRMFLVLLAVSIAVVDAQRPRDVTWSLPPPPPPPGVAASCELRSTCGSNGANARLPFHARNCFCDDTCRIYDDCCADFAPTSPLAIDVNGTGSGNTPTFNCLRIEDIDTSFEYYIVDRCPRDYTANATVKELCRDETLDDLFYRLPVAGHTSGLLYRNAYCALCAGEKDYSFWRVVHRCTPGSGSQHSVPIASDDPEATIRQLTQCVADLLPPEVADGVGGNGLMLPRKCKSHVNKCDRKTKAGRRGSRCTGPTSYVYDGLQAYRNEECARCNGIQRSTCEDGRTPQVELEVELDPGDISGGRPGTSQPAAQPSPPRRVQPPTVTFIVDFNSAAGLLHQNSPSRGVPLGNVTELPVAEDQPTVIPLRRCAIDGDVYDPYAQMCRSVKFRRIPTIATTVPTTTEPQTTPTTTLVSTVTMAPTTTTMMMTTKKPTTTTSTPIITTISTTTVLPEATSLSGKAARNKVKATTTVAPFLFPVELDDGDEGRLPDGDYWETPSGRRSNTARTRKFQGLTTTPLTTVDDQRSKNQQHQQLPDELWATSTMPNRRVFPSSSFGSSTQKIPSAITPVSSPSDGASENKTPLVVPTCQLLPVDGNYELLNNGSLSVMTSSSRDPIVYSVHEYARINNSLFICVVRETNDDNDDDVTSGSGRLQREKLRDSSTLIAVYQLDRVQSLASLVGVLVSITALIACILVVLCLPLLRGNSHGCSLVCLIVCLLVGQSLYLITTLYGYRQESSPNAKSSAMCYWISVLTHYFLLATFFWLNVLAMDTTRKAFSARDTVVDPQMPPTYKIPTDSGKTCCQKSARFLAYSIYAWLLPAAVVLGSVAGDVIHVEEPLLRAHYAEAGVCWLAGRHGITLLVGLPLAALTAANLVLYTLALAVVGCDVIDGSVSVLRRRAVAGLVLTALLALMWASALVAAYLQLPLVWYVFVGLQAGVGLFTCFAFAVNQETFTMLQRNRKHYDVGYDDNSRNGVTGPFKDASGTNGNGSTAWGGPNHVLPVPSYDEVISHETSV